jgi:hypothetical protein
MFAEGEGTQSTPVKQNSPEDSVGAEASPLR